MQRVVSIIQLCATRIKAPHLQCNRQRLEIGLSAYNMEVMVSRRFTNYSVNQCWSRPCPILGTTKKMNLRSQFTGIQYTAGQILTFLSFQSTRRVRSSSGRVAPPRDAAVPGSGSLKTPVEALALRAHLAVPGMSFMSFITSWSCPTGPWRPSIRWNKTRSEDRRMT